MNCKVAFIALVALQNFYKCLIWVCVLTHWFQWEHSHPWSYILVCFQDVTLNPKAVNCRAGPANLIYLCGSTDFTRKMETMSWQYLSLACLGIVPVPWLNIKLSRAYSMLVWLKVQIFNRLECWFWAKSKSNDAIPLVLQTVYLQAYLTLHI